MQKSLLAIVLTIASSPMVARAQFRVNGVPPRTVTAPTATTSTVPAAAQPATSSTTSALVVGGGDSCSAADAIAGAGLFTVDTTLATDGVPDSGGCPNTNRDVWFYWTSPFTGGVTVETCGGTGADTVITVWADNNGGACPSGVAIACNDDTCLLQSRVTFLATAATSYFFQFGGVAPATVYSGTFSIALSAPPSNDSVFTPLPAPPLGTFPFDNTFATTGAEGQSEAACLFAGSTAIEKDVWFTWTPSVTGGYTIQTCGQTAVDTKMAIYQASGPPLGAALDCNDDACGQRSILTVSAVGGTTYMIQVGVPVGGQGGGGTVTTTACSTPAASDTCTAPPAAPAVPTEGGAPTKEYEDVLDMTNANSTNVPLGTSSACEVAFHEDVWRTWTPTVTGTYEIEVCPVEPIGWTPSIDLYNNTSTCPSASPINCRVPCGTGASLICIEAVAGITYMLQIGVTQPTISPNPDCWTAKLHILHTACNDNCTRKRILEGNGFFIVDTTDGTTGPDGQSSGKCDWGGSMSIENDVWFEWTAPTTGTVQVSTCGLVPFDSKIAAYFGANCPPGQALACNDDACGGVGSQICFDVVAGGVYTLQIGSSPFAPAGGVGQFSIGYITPPTGCVYDNGTSEVALGFTGSAADFVWMHRFGAIGTTTTVSAVEAAFGTPALVGFGPTPGTVVTVCVWDDPNDDGDPADAVLLSQTNGVVTNVDNDVLDVFPFAPVVVNDVFFVGVGLTQPNGQFPAPLDQDACPVTSDGRAWIAAEIAGLFNYAQLALNTLPPVELDALTIPGVFLLRASCSSSPPPPGAPYCFGDGTFIDHTTPCPCTNNGAAGNGCSNSFNPNGANLAATGNTNPDTVVLTTSGMPLTGTAIYLQGTGLVDQVFGDGVLCTGGSLVRLRTRFSVGGTSSFPDSSDTVTLSVRGGVTPGSGAVRRYQTYYRNAAAGFCPPATFNVSNGWEILW